MPLPWHTSRIHKVVGNKAKGRISKRVFQEYKARQIFRKSNISHPLIRTRTCAYQGVRNDSFSENFAYLLNEWFLTENLFCVPGKCAQY